MTPEGRVKQQVNKFLKEHNVYYFMPIPIGLGATTLDTLCCWNGRFVAIECKAGKNDLTLRQRLTILQIQAAGGMTFVVRDTSPIPNQMERIRDAVARSRA